MPETSHNATSVDPVNGISDIYSDIDMRMRLATKPNEKACSGDACMLNQAFDAQVQALGARLAQSAYVVYPDLKKKIPNFVFSVADKKVLGSASNAKGAVVLFREIQHLDLGEEATAFLIAREMGHVIANHHKSNAKTKIFFSVLAGVLFPAVSILSASSAATQATTATSVLTSAASTATSFVGSEVALSRIKPSQLSEADDVSIALLQHEGLSKAEVAQSLEFVVENENATAWEKDLYESIHYVRKLANDPKEAKVEIVELEPLPEKYEATEASMLVPVAKPASNEQSSANVVAQTNELTQALPVEQKPVEQRKVILITNQSLAESRNQAIAVREKKSVLAPIKVQTAKKNMSKNINNGKNKTKQVSIAKTKQNSVKTSKNLAVKSIKKSTSTKASKKVSAVKSKLTTKDKPKK